MDLRPPLPADQHEQSLHLAALALEFGYPVGLSNAHKLAVLGMRRLSPPVTHRAPVTVAILRQLRRNLDLQQPTDRVIWGAAVLGYFFLLRRSEYLSVEGKEQSFIIRKVDVTLSNEHGEAVDNPRDATRRPCHSNVQGRLRGLHDQAARTMEK
ncbi:hypothetical protein ATCC90586_011083 [Pythium insidiosum]|nr:hypothetical protein ATCC90586_011083 [Pythium insidiosum]